MWTLSVIKLASHFSKSHADVVPNMFLLLCLLESVLKIRCFQLIFVVDEIVLCLEVNSGQKGLSITGGQTSGLKWHLDSQHPTALNSGKGKSTTDNKKQVLFTTYGSGRVISATWSDRITVLIGQLITDNMLPVGNANPGGGLKPSVCGFDGLQNPRTRV